MKNDSNPERHIKEMIKALKEASQATVWASLMLRNDSKTRVNLHGIELQKASEMIDTWITELETQCQK